MAPHAQSFAEALERFSARALAMLRTKLKAEQVPPTTMPLTPPPPPSGTLKEWHWGALAEAYAAGGEGLEGSYGEYANIGVQCQRA